MNSKRFLIQFQYLGFRYHGVQIQPQLPSIHSRIHQCLLKQFKADSFTLRFSSRTDALVSAEQSYFLIMFESNESLDDIVKTLKTLPPDLQIINGKAVDDDFILMKQIDKKIYHYFFAHKIEKPHAFAAPFMTMINEEMDIELMKEAAKVFLGTHDFSNYCYKPRASTQFIKTITRCELERNNELQASFIPKESYVLKIESSGFMRGQVRLMTGALFRVGTKQLTVDELKNSLRGPDNKFIKWMVPSSGLVLHRTLLID